MQDPLPPLREVIAAHDLGAKKSLGQNFLLDLNLTRKIARTAGDLSEACVLEVGPGPGGLTRGLLMEGAAHVIAIERDDRCLPALAEISTAFPGRLTVIADDAMAVDEAGLIAQHGLPKARVVSNLPYNVGTALLIKWITTPDWPSWFDSLTLMFQREVAERIVAERGVKAYSRLSIMCGFRTQAKIAFDVPARAFTPAPKVTSSVVHLAARQTPLADINVTDLETVVTAAFGQRRKMLRQSLKQLGGDTLDLLKAAQIEPTLRAENLSIEEFCRLAAVYQKQLS